jgi:hypothetical protein
METYPLKIAVKMNMQKNGKIEASIVETVANNLSSGHDSTILFP